MKIPEHIVAAARERVRRTTPDRQRVLEAIRAGRPLEAEPDEERKCSRFRRVAGVSAEDAARLARGESAAALGLPRERRTAAERIQGTTVDFVGVSFLERARRAASAVARVVSPDFRPRGSGFLVSDRLFLTNNHVIPSADAARDSVVEFDYEVGIDGLPREVSRFRLAPDRCFVTRAEDDLDFTLVALGSRISGPGTPAAFGCCPLVATDDRHVLGEFVNLVQHPEGDYKQVVLRENRLVTRLSTVLHYMADTLPGSSGSPVFNDQWEVIALHHWGEPFQEVELPDGRRVQKDVNEGIRISALARTVRTMLDGLTPDTRALLDDALRLPDRPDAGEVRPPVIDRPQTGDREQGESGRGRAVVRADGTVVWTVPIEIAIRVGDTVAGPGGTVASGADVGTDTAGEPAPGPEAVKIDRNYANRRGYDRTFLPGHRVDLPRLGPGLEGLAARKKRVTAGDDPFELRYQHFSVVMHRQRRLAFFTAGNIDGATWVDIDRDSGQPREAAEAAEVWYADPRLDAEAQCDQSLYDRQRPRRLFDRGHLVRRQDPAWGSRRRAARANADTFHFTNCTPQESRFNQTKEFWQGIERWILEDSAVADRERVTVFTGPVLGDADPPYRYVRVPTAFWKIVAYVRDGELRATALLASQADRIRRLPEGAERMAEDLDDVSAVEEFQTSVGEIEALTGLDFGPLRAHDTLVRRGGGEAASARRRLRAFDDIAL
jgi:endonuclease G